jgi:hypothetical protein
VQAPVGLSCRRSSVSFGTGMPTSVAIRARPRPSGPGTFPAFG